MKREHGWKNAKEQKVKGENAKGAGSLKCGPLLIINTVIYGQILHISSHSGLKSDNKIGLLDAWHEFAALHVVT